MTLPLPITHDVHKLMERSRATYQDGCLYLSILPFNATVNLILEKMAASQTSEQIVAAHPRLTREAIQAALKFAAKVLHADVIYPTTESAA